jgi:hypothetical protein
MEGMLAKGLFGRGNLKVSTQRGQPILPTPSQPESRHRDRNINVFPIIPISRDADARLCLCT